MIDIMEDFINQDFKLLDDVTKEILEDSPGYPSPIGINAIIDQKTLQGVCTMNESRGSLHEQYRCGSLQNQLAFFKYC